MTDPALIWSQACEHLAQERYDLAYQLLEQRCQQAAPPERTRLGLYLVSVMSLYAPGDGPDNFAGMEGELFEALMQVQQDDPAAATQPLFLALLSEVQARTLGRAAASVPEEARHALGEDGPLARYHSVCALALSGRWDEMAAIAPAARELPMHLRWRLRQWQARAEEAQGNLLDATNLYADAAHLAQGISRAALLQEEAALHMQQGELGRASQRLEQARSLYPRLLDADEYLGLASWYYLQAQLELSRDQPDAALQHVREAGRLEQEYGDPSYGVALLWGQVLTALGQPEEALAHFTEALNRAAPEDQPYAHHELGVALLDLDRPLEAREHLEAILKGEYPYAAEVLADMAECDYRLGHLQEAQQKAEQALEQGAAVPARLVLGSVAMEYYHLDEALGHYQQVAQEAAPGSRDWVVAHQMAADIMSQQGFSDPAAAYAHAQQALEHTDPSDEWYATLEDHLQRAGALMGAGSGRTLN